MVGMATKKPTGTKPKPKPEPAPAPTRLQNLAARRDDDLDEDGQLVDHSGVFRVTSSLQRGARAARDEDASMRFPNDSLVMAAQRDNFRDDGPTLDDATEEHAVDDETARVDRRARLATLAARNKARQRPPR